MRVAGQKHTGNRPPIGKNTDKETIAIICSEMGCQHYDDGKHHDALEKYEEALTYLRRIFGKTHPYVVRVTKNIAIICSEMGRQHYDDGKHHDALEKYEEALTYLRRIFGKTHPYVVRVTKMIATICTEMGRQHYNDGKHHDALRVFCRLLRLQLSFLGDSHPFVGKTHYSMALLYKNKLKNIPAARRHFDSAYIIWYRTYGESNVGTVKAKEKRDACEINILYEILIIATLTVTLTVSVAIVDEFLRKIHPWYSYF